MKKVLVGRQKLCKHEAAMEIAWLKRPGIILIVTIIFGLSLVTLGCEGGFEARGTIYRWVDPPENAKSTVFVEQKPSKEIVVAPLGATVRIRGKNGTGSGWKAYSDENGKYVISTVTVFPGTYIITAERTGYVTATGEFVISSKNKNGRFYNINIVLVSAK